MVPALSLKMPFSCLIVAAGTSTAVVAFQSIRRYPLGMGTPVPLISADFGSSAVAVATEADVLGAADPA
jgi:hypothetical protein